MTGVSTALACALLEDGSLVLSSDAIARRQVEHWLPRLPLDSSNAAVSPAVIAVARGEIPASPSEPTPDLTLGPIRAWTRIATDRIVLHARQDTVAGNIDLKSLSATLALSHAATRPEPRNAAVFSALTLSSALLLNRIRRALVHAAAVVDPNGAAWLLVGDAFAGKTTTTVNLIRAGWDYLSDDHVVLARAADGSVVAEGWPRAFHLDRGYEVGVSRGERAPVDPARFGPGRWRRTAPLAGVLFPQVAADQPTQTWRLPPADALARVIRQSPWLLADSLVARDILALLRDSIARAAFVLRLGRDSYRDPVRLLDALHTPIRQP